MNRYTAYFFYPEWPRTATFPFEAESMRKAEAFAQEMIAFFETHEWKERLESEGFPFKPGIRLNRIMDNGPIEPHGEGDEIPF